MSSQPLCFVLMPFGLKPDPAGGADIHFDRIYELAVKPGIEDAGMLPIRADEEKLGGIIHKAMFERLLVCDFAVADLTTGNPNVMYELGVRHAARPRTTLTIYAQSTPLPFDVRLLKTQSYQLGDGNQFPDPCAAALQSAVTSHLVELAGTARESDVRDSPLFQLITGWNPAPLQQTAADSFQDQARANEDLKQRLKGIAATHEAQHSPAAMAQLERIRSDLFGARGMDVGVLTELMLTHRALENWTGMIEVYDAMPATLQRQVPIRQQLAFAFNRRAESTGSDEDRIKALQILEAVEREQGPSAETSGLLGRIYKSQWRAERNADNPVQARRYLAKAVKAYVRGFETDWREVYPGINAVTLLEVQGGDKALQLKDRLLPVVRFAAEQRLRSANADYWDHATILELAVLAAQPGAVSDVLDEVLASSTEAWQLESTAGNLRIIQTTWAQQGRQPEWLQSIIDTLDAAAGDRVATSRASG